MIVDAHQHFWDPARGDYGWLTPDMPIHRIFGPGELAPLMQSCGVKATIIVQAAATVAETDYLLEIARRTSFVLGVVGWIAMDAPDAVAQVKVRAADPLFLGLRPMLQDIAQHDWILQPALEPALVAVAEAGLVFDALALSNQIGVVEELARRFARLSIVLDHGAKPKLGDAAALRQWRTGMAKLAARPNVTCKLSGLLTELPVGADIARVREAMGTLFDLFGPDRLLWGSDWPVLTIAHERGNYRDWFLMAHEIIAAHKAVPAVMGKNALRVYRPSRADIFR